MTSLNITLQETVLTINLTSPTGDEASIEVSRYADATGTVQVYLTTLAGWKDGGSATRMSAQEAGDVARQAADLLRTLGYTDA